ncbi:putative 2-amino-4-hydroxy-6-hydroxymethyldihydropteridine diphosphokinase [Rosa chinensis]|uniref:2-amino-4-hydroxy-6-hydroxymethyldihydropteridine diphosphokinase n=1 Tax=Rosa chinensis TaxID=74649 RepID=A0A2P6RX52_ROSCH|nr:putative 2-amino-4-hydroxy-6-hydroxymethyldihydropteridine diphosphokinase [Rosa chinensis]
MHIFKQLLPDISRLNGAKKYFQASCFAFIHSSPNSPVEVHSQDQEVVIALGSNVGDRLHNFNEALQLMKKSVRAVTKLGPHELLGALKKIEKDMGRTQGIRYGPRPIDLDILFYGKLRVRSEILTIPHERIWERPFVIYSPIIGFAGISY